MKVGILARGWRLPLGFLPALFGAVLISIFSFIAPAHTSVLTVDITGTGAGKLGTNSFSSGAFDFTFVGPTGSCVANCIDLTSATVTVPGFTANITLPAQIGVIPASYAAFFRETGGSDLIDVIFTPADFATLDNAAFGPLPGQAGTNFADIPTSLGTLHFDSFSDVHLTGSGNDPAAAPELSTWVMMLLGFAGVGLVAYRRTKKNSAAIATA